MSDSSAVSMPLNLIGIVDRGRQGCSLRLRLCCAGIWLRNSCSMLCISCSSLVTCRGMPLSSSLLSLIILVMLIGSLFLVVARCLPSLVT